MRESFGELIRRLRLQHGYTLTQLGAQLGIDSGALSKIENGKKRVDKRCLPLLAKVFSIDSEKLKNEFFSEMIAYDIISNSCDESVLRLAEEKIKHMKSKNIKQSILTF